MSSGPLQNCKLFFTLDIELGSEGDGDDDKDTIIL